MPPRRHPRAYTVRQRHIERRRRLRRRAAPLAILAAAAFIIGAIMASGSAEEDAAMRFVEAWARQDFPAMHAELTDAAKRETSVQELEEAYRSSEQTATATAIDPGEAGGPQDSGGREVVPVEVTVRTDTFGEVEGELEVPVEDGKIAWDPSATFPGLRGGERLASRLELGERAAILAKDGTPLAEGSGAGRSSPIGSDAVDVTGTVEQPDAEQKEALEQQGVPTDQPTGVSGLELAFNTRLTGIAGGQLLAVEGEGGTASEGTQGRVLANARERPGQPVETTIDPDLQEATVAALGGQFGGAVVLDARNGEVLALAGTAFSAPAPPGSTFKIITTVAALEEEKVKLEDEFDVVTEINAGGRVIDNAHDEPCGGTFVQAFANSCNTVFAPLGVEVGEEKLVETAEKFGWNSSPTLYNDAARKATDIPASTIPKDPGDDVDLAASAIGQGQVLATPLSMASVAQTIANKGTRSPNPIVTEPALQSSAKPVQVTSPEIAATLKSLMVDVVEYGTGTAAALPGVTVAGKTGTAELGPKPGGETTTTPEGTTEPEQLIDAWFAAFAPAKKPRLAVAVFLSDAEGDGGEVAAPIAQEIFSAAF
jgi:peptidoglycan glycosyltransferase